MKFLLSALLIVLSFFSSFIIAQQTDEARPVSFKMASVKGFSMQGSFKGEYRILPDSIELKIIKGDILLADNAPYRGSRLLDHLTFGLATLTKDGKGFQTVKTSRSKPLAIKEIMRPLDKHSFANVYFSIPKEKSMDLSKVWIVATMTVDILEPYQGMKQKTGVTYAHTCQSIFTLKNNASSCISRF
jgi:hypothetical protein